MVKARLELLDDPSEDVRKVFTYLYSKGHALFITTDSRGSNRLRPQFGSTRVFPSRVLEAQTLHERPIHLLDGGVNEIDK